MNEILSVFNTLPLLHQVFWGCAVVSSLIFLVQMVLTLIGMDSSDVDVDFDGPDTMDLGGSLNLFTIRNFIGFLVGFGWTGVVFYDTITNRLLLSLLAFIVGALFVGMFVVIYKQTKRLEHNGAFRISQTEGLAATVYLRIPMDGKGKVQVSLNGSVHELDAVTDGTELPSGTNVVITQVVDSHTVRVERNV